MKLPFLWLGQLRHKASSGAGPRWGRGDVALTTGAVCLLLWAAPVSAQTDAERTLAMEQEQQRAWIDETRNDYRSRFRERERACYQRFAVNDCLAESRRAERTILSDLRRQEILINDAQRKRRAAAQLLRTDKLQESDP